MKNQLRHVDDLKLVGLYLLIEALSNRKGAVTLSNESLRSLLDTERPSKKQVRQLSAAFAPFLVNSKLLDRAGYPREAMFFVPGASNKGEILLHPSIPPTQTMERTLGLEIHQRNG